MITKACKIVPLVSFSLLMLVPLVAFAHQPRVVLGRETLVTEPEISKAYYGHLTGEPDVFIIDSPTPFDLYVNVLVPAIAGQKKDVSAAILKEGKQAAVLDGMNFTWKKFYEEFGADTYWLGPEFETRAEPGRYEIRVWSSNNDSKYSLAVGKVEAFDAKEGLNALTLIPKLKSEFFDESPLSFIKSPFGYGLIIFMYLLAFILGLLYRAVLKRFTKDSVRTSHHNIGRSDRVIRLLIGVALLLWAITTSWSSLLLFLSGFAFFEAIFSWCGFNAAIGKNTCPSEGIMVPRKNSTT